MKVTEVRLDVTTAAGQTGSALSKALFGELFAVRWNQGTAAATTDATFTYTNADGESVTLLTLTDVSADATYYPREQVHGNTGTGLTLDGTRIAAEPPLIAGPVTLSIAQGGATKVCNALLYILRE